MKDIASFGVIRAKQFIGPGSSELPSTTGKYFYVHKNGRRDTGVETVTTLAGAYAKARANRGDVIVIGEGHTETISSSLTLDKAGVTIIGIGKGNDRPVFSLSATGSTFAMSGASQRLLNVVLVAAIDSVVAGVTLSAADCEIDIETQDTSSLIEYVSQIVTTAAADRAKINLKHVGFLAGDACTRGIDVVGMNSGTINVDWFGVASTAIVSLRTTASDNVRVTGKFHNGTTAISKDVTDTASSTWSVEGFDVVSGSKIVGGSGMDPFAGYNPRLGFGVTKVSNLADGSGTDNLFTVTGRVLITSLTGEVTTVIGGAATMKLRDITNSVDLCAATTIDTDAVGTMYALTSISANILNGTGATPVVGSIPNITGAQQTDVAIVGNAQAPITIAHVLDAADTGAVTWRLTYIPLISGSTVVAAA